jgi:hypothetical protein
MASPRPAQKIIAEAVSFGRCLISEGKRWVGIIDPELYRELVTKFPSGSVVSDTVPDIGARRVIKYMSENGNLYILYNERETLDMVDQAWAEKERVSGVERV